MAIRLPNCACKAWVTDRQFWPPKWGSKIKTSKKALSLASTTCVASASVIPVAGYLVLKSENVKPPDDRPLKKNHGDPEIPCPWGMPWRISGQ